MAVQLKLEVCVALAPSLPLAMSLASLSEKLAAQNSAGATILTLEGVGRRLGLAPHLTMYQLPLPLEKMSAAVDELYFIAKKYSDFSLQGSNFTANATEGSIELKYSVTPDLAALQMEVVEKLSPLRCGLCLERSPAGLSVADAILEDDDENSPLSKYGFGEYGDTFNPHVTLSWLRPGCTSVADPLVSGAAPDYSGVFDCLNVYAMGPQGTCPQLLVSLPFVK